MARRDQLRFHLIGHLQSNKAARAAELFDGIDTLDSLRLADGWTKRRQVQKKLPVLSRSSSAAKPQDGPRSGVGGSRTTA